jgi:Cullin family/Cullin protein neddylation domain
MHNSSGWVESVPASLAAAAPVLAEDGEAFDAELERRWSSVRAGLVEVLTALEARANPPNPPPPPAAAAAPAAAGRPQKRRKAVEPAEWTRVYSDVAVLFGHNDPAKKRRTYGRVRHLLRDHVREQLATLRLRVHGSGIALLEQYTLRWDMSVQFVRYMKRVLHHLEHWVVLNSCNRSKTDPIRPLDRLLMFYWCEEVLANLPELVNILLDMIDDDRKGKPVDHSPLKAVIDTLVVLGSADAPPPTTGKVNSPSRRPHMTRRNTDGSGNGGLASNSGPGSRIGANAATEQRDKAIPIFGDDTEAPLSLHLYLQVFEDEFLRRTATFYAAEAEKMMRGNCVSTFMQNVVSRLDEEVARGERLLHKESVPRLRSTVEEKLVGAHMTYLQQEADVMVREGRERDLKIVFKLLERLDGGLGPIRDCLCKHIIEEGVETMRARADLLNSKEDVKKSIVIVDDIISLHKSRTDMIQRCFGSAQIFVMALNDAFRTFVNKPVGALAMPEIISYYVDNLMRSPRGSTISGCETPYVESSDLALVGELGPTANLQSGDQSISAELDPRSEQMDRIVRLFMYLDDKDMFHETYRSLLAKRLLGKHDDEVEREFISKLKHQMGFVYTGKLCGMFQDVAVSNETRRRFLEYINATDGATTGDEASSSRLLPACGIDFTAHVLNGLYWPSFQVDHLRIPSPLVQCQDSFTSFFMRDKQLRKVTWIHSQSTNHVSASLGDKVYTLVVSTFQACALLEFNATSRICLERLSSALNVEPAAMVRHMQPLVDSKKHRLFNCYGDLRKVASDVATAREDGAAARRDGAAAVVRSTGECGEEDKENPSVQPTRDVISEELSDSSDEHSAQLRDTVPTVVLQRAGQQGTPGVVEAGISGEGGPSSGLPEPLVAGDVPVLLLRSSNLGEVTSNAHGIDGIGTVSAGNAEHNDNDDDYGIDDDDSPDVDAVIAPIGAPRDLASLAMVAAAFGLQSSFDDPRNSGQEVEIAPSFIAPELGHTIEDSGNRLSSARSRNVVNPAEQRDMEMRLGIDLTPQTACDHPNGRVATGAPLEHEVAGAISDAGEDEDASVDGDGPPAVGTIPDCVSSGEVHLSQEPSNEASGVFYELVESFSSKSVRIVYPSMIARITTREAARGRKVVVVDRGSLVDAALVRIMKQRKTLPLTQLTGEVLQQVSGTFKPEVRLIKERIELLIEREFIERSAEDANVFEYCS